MSPLVVLLTPNTNQSISLFTCACEVGYGGQEKGVESEVVDQWFAAQRRFYVDMGKKMGDQRAVDLRGKLLRRCGAQTI